MVDHAHRIGAERPSIARLPHISFQTVAYHPYLSGPASTKSLHLNQDLTNFLGRRKRGESKWDFDSRNVPYGILSATPRNVPSDGLAISSTVSGIQFPSVPVKNAVAGNHLVLTCVAPTSPCTDSGAPLRCGAMRKRHFQTRRQSFAWHTSRETKPRKPIDAGRMLAERKQIMEAWAAFAIKPIAKVINIDSPRVAWWDAKRSGGETSDMCALSSPAGIS